MTLFLHYITKNNSRSNGKNYFILQKAIKKLQDSYMEQLDDDERKTLSLQIETLERSDTLNSNK
ncbi:DUF5388 domain-containing protein [Companilactobacillus paralimentarius]|uniref:DUF5388 domain-containing protein n=1 Tax=Companilactobacillus paralimentarius TaxID=83526 RepID=UPI00384CD307